ncbi:TolC family protein [bacterium]|nr:TolC family protein [Balneola sp.]MBR9917611.1 TolC family protein [bacterium]
MKKIFSIFFSFILVSVQAVYAQDTLEISLRDFIDLGLSNSGQIKYDKTSVDLAENRVSSAKDQRFLPSLNFRSEHALVPGVSSPGNFPEEEIYLDPNAKNDWDKVGVFNRLRITGVQPVFTWGSINKAISAAEEAVKATEFEFQAKKEDMEVRLFELYYSYVLALEIERLLKDAEDKINQIENSLDDAQEEGDDIDETDVYKFKVFKAQFGIQKAEVDESLVFVKQTWEYILRNENGTIYIPSIRYLDPLAVKLSGLDHYQNSAFLNRNELRGISTGKEALMKYIDYQKASNLPGLYLGFTTTFASTPIRPRQPNPFISTPENTFNTAFGITIRQNLNFFQAKTQLDRVKIELRKMDYLSEAAKDGILLEVNQAYQKAAVAEVKVERTDEALLTTKQWLRMEQQDYDFGIGEVKDLIDAMKMELELRLKEKESIFEFNTSMAKLNNAAGIPLELLQNNN